MTPNRNRPGVEINKRVHVPTPRSDLISLGDHDTGLDPIRNYDFNEFDFLSDNYHLNMGFITPSVIGANPNNVFHRACNELTSEVDKGEVFDENLTATEWNIPHFFRRKLGLNSYRDKSIKSS